MPQANIVITQSNANYQTFFYMKSDLQFLKHEMEAHSLTFISAAVEETYGVILKSLLSPPRSCALQPDLKPY